MLFGNGLLKNTTEIKMSQFNYICQVFNAISKFLKK